MQDSNEKGGVHCFTPSFTYGFCQTVAALSQDKKDGEAADGTVGPKSFRILALPLGRLKACDESTFSIQFFLR